MIPRFKKEFLILGIAAGALLLSFLVFIYYEGKREPFAIGKLEPTQIKILRGNDTLCINQNQGTWYINYSYPANIEEIQFFIGILQSLKGYAQASINPSDSVLSLIKSKGTLVRIFKGRNVIKEYWVASIPAFNYKPIGLLMNSHCPYYIETPTASDDLIEYFSTSPNRWLAGRLFPEPIEWLANISVSYPNRPQSSYRLTFDDRQLFVTDGNGVRYDSVKMVEVSMLYFSLDALKLEGATVEQQESAKPANLIANVAFEMQNGKKYEFSLYRINGENFKNVLNEPIDYDPNKFLIEYQNEKRFLIGYYFHFHHLLQSINYLVNNSSN